MGFIDSVSSTFNYHITSFNQTIEKKIAATPSAAKKCFQLVYKSFAVFDLLKFGRVVERPLINSLKSSKEVIDFYSSYKDIVYWINPFSKETLEQDALKKSIKDALCWSKDAEEFQFQEEIAKQVFNDVMSEKSLHSQGQVREAIRKSLKKHSTVKLEKQIQIIVTQIQVNKKKSSFVQLFYKKEITQKKYENLEGDKLIELLVSRIQIRKKKRSFVQILFMICFTITDLWESIETLKKWKILDLSNLANKMGIPPQLFSKADHIRGMIFCSGLVLFMGEKISQIGKLTSQIRKLANEEERSKKQSDLKIKLIDLLNATVELVAAATPLLYKTNPVHIHILSIIAKGTGLICFLSK